MQKIELPIDKNESSPTNPDFSWGFKMLAIFVWFLVFSYLIFFIFSNVVLKNLSLETEKEWFWDFSEWEKFNYTDYSDYKIEEFNNYNFLLDESDEVNAYAFIGWNITINKGFLYNIEHQEELVFVMAHEMWHIKNRDVLKAFTTEIPLQLTLMSLWIDIWIWDSSLTSIWWKYLNKNTELEADKIWLEILKKYKINPLCAKAFFTREHNSADTVMELLSDHPLNISRIKLLEDLAREMWFKDEKNCKKLKKQ